MSEKPKAFRTPAIEAQEALSVMAAAADALPVLEAGGMRVQFYEGGYCRLVLPAQPVGRSANADGKQYEAALNSIIEAFNQGPAQFRREAGARSLSIDGLPTPIVAAMEIAMRIIAPGSAREVGTVERAARVGEECLIVLDADDTVKQIEQASMLVRRCPMTRLGVHEEAVSGAAYLVLHLDDDTDRRSTLGGLIAGGGFPAGRVLARYDSSAGPVFLPTDWTLPMAVLRDLGRVLASYTDALENEETVAFGAFVDGDVTTTFRTALPVKDAQTVLGSETPTEEIVWRFLDLRESEEAAGRLRSVLADLKPRSGYRLSLHGIRDRVRGNVSLERILEAIAELEVHAALIQGLQSKQLRLLRFSAEQLPAMADFLSRVPIQEIDRGKIRYGFQATAMAPLGLHYLMYDPDELSLERPFPEWEWRERTNDTPIRYWVDPNWARHYGGGTGVVRSVVFTPHGTVLHPTLHSFSAGDMDGYLRALMLERFTGHHHSKALGEMLEDRSRATGFVFDRARDPDFEISVEVLDLESFKPVRQRLDWINDHLLLIDPSVVAPERITLVAESLFEGRVAESLLRETGARSSELKAASDAIDEHFLGQVGNIMKRVESEIVSMGERADDAVRFLEDLSARMVTLETLMDKEFRNFKSATREADNSDTVAADLETYRETFETRIRDGFEKTDRFVAEAEKRIEKARNGLTLLRTKLDSLRDDR